MAKRTSKPASTAPGTDAGEDAPAPKGSYKLVIVESPAKAKTITKYLGAGFKVEASRGHIRDLPPRAPKGSKQPVPGVDLDNDFEPTYEVSDDRKAQVTALKKLAKGASEIWFATDLDREGEAIAWHLTQVLGVDPSRAKRVTFDAITKAEIQRAFQSPRAINMPRVEAQQARRIVDRIGGLFEALLAGVLSCLLAGALVGALAGAALDGDAGVELGVGGADDLHLDARRVLENLPRRQQFALVDRGIEGEGSFGARGGVYIGGGIVPRFVDHLQRSEFRAQFVAKGRLRGYLERVPTRVIRHPNPAFVGLLSLARQAPGPLPGPAPR